MNDVSFKKGDVVVCVHTQGFLYGLTIGKQYTIIEDSISFNYFQPSHCIIVNDHGEWFTYNNYRFLDVTKYRNSIINEILE